MAEFRPKRFWSEVRIESQPEGYALRLDDKLLRTPQKTSLLVPTQALAEAVADEWRVVEDRIMPETMPFTRSVNVVLDRLAHEPGPVIDMLAEYAGSDCLCYRAAEPSELQERQATLWDPMLDWCRERFDAPLIVVAGIIYADQPERSLLHLRQEIAKCDAFELAALHDLITLTGSVVLGLAVLHDRVSAQTAWDLSRVEESWQVEQWGSDSEAEALAAKKRADVLQAERLLRALGRLTPVEG